MKKPSIIFDGKIKKTAAADCLTAIRGGLFIL